MGERFVDPFRDPNDEEALETAVAQVDGASAHMAAEGIGADDTEEDMIDGAYITEALHNNPDKGSSTNGNS